MLDDDATDDAVRSLVALSCWRKKASSATTATPDSFEWDKGGERACAYLGLPGDETADLLDQSLDRLHRAGQ